MNKSVLKDKFNKKTNNKFDYIRLSHVTILIYSKVAEYSFIYPESKKQEVLDNKELIEQHLDTILKSVFDNSITLTSKHLDIKHFTSELFEIINKYPALASTINPKELKITRQGIIEGAHSDTINIKFALEKPVYDFVTQNNVVTKITDELYNKYTESFVITLESYDISTEESEHRESVRNFDSSVRLEREGGREIVVSNVQSLIGGLKEDRAGYIVDAIVPKKNVVLCGTLMQWDVGVSKNGNTKFVRLELKDFTESIRGVYFYKDSTAELVASLQAGDDVIVQGDVEQDTYQNNKRLNFKLKSVSKCTLPTDFLFNRKKRPVPIEYTTVIPKPYTDTTQSSIELDLLSATVASDIIAPSQKPTVVVFDLETTGLNASEDSIIDIGAVKIEGGLIVATFESLVDPLIDVPDNIVELTHITTDMVRGQPTVEPVLIDFLKFCDNAILVAHNIDFDYSFISNSGKKYDIYYDNIREDTLALSRQKYPRLKDHKLGTMCKHLDITNSAAHRALSDALATAKLYIHLKGW